MGKERIPKRGAEEEDDLLLEKKGRKSPAKKAKRLTREEKQAQLEAQVSTLTPTVEQVLSADPAESDVLKGHLEAVPDNFILFGSKQKSVAQGQQQIEQAETNTPLTADSIAQTEKVKYDSAQQADIERDKQIEVWEANVKEVIAERYRNVPTTYPKIRDELIALGWTKNDAQDIISTARKQIIEKRRLSEQPQENPTPSTTNPLGFDPHSVRSMVSVSLQQEVQEDLKNGKSSPRKILQQEGVLVDKDVDVSGANNTPYVSDDEMQADMNHLSAIPNHEQTDMQEDMDARNVLTQYPLRPPVQSVESAKKTIEEESWVPHVPPEALVGENVAGAEVYDSLILNPRAREGEMIQVETSNPLDAVILPETHEQHKVAEFISFGKIRPEKAPGYNEDAGWAGDRAGCVIDGVSGGDDSMNFAQTLAAYFKENISNPEGLDEILRKFGANKVVSEKLSPTKRYGACGTVFRQSPTNEKELEYIIFGDPSLFVVDDEGNVTQIKDKSKNNDYRGQVNVNLKGDGEMEYRIKEDRLDYGLISIDKVKFAIAMSDGMTDNLSQEELYRRIVEISTSSNPEAALAEMIATARGNMDGHDPELVHSHPDDISAALVSFQKSAESPQVTVEPTRSDVEIMFDAPQELVEGNDPRIEQMEGLFERYRVNEIKRSEFTKLVNRNLTPEEKQQSNELSDEHFEIQRQLDNLIDQLHPYESDPLKQSAASPDEVRSRVKELEADWVRSLRDDSLEGHINRRILWRQMNELQEKLDVPEVPLNGSGPEGQRIDPTLSDEPLAEELVGPPKPERTPAEERSFLRRLILDATEKTKEKVKSYASSSEQLIRQSKDLDAKLENIGGVEKGFRWMGEKYNKLGWKSKLGVGIALGLGAGISAPVNMGVAAAFLSGIAAQRIAGLATMYLKFEKSELEKGGKFAKEKAMGKAILYTAGMTAGTMYAVEKITEMDIYRRTQEWLGNILGHTRAQPAAPAPSTPEFETGKSVVDSGPEKAAGTPQAPQVAAPPFAAEAVAPVPASAAAAEARATPAVIQDKVAITAPPASHGISPMEVNSRGYEYTLKQLVRGLPEGIDKSKFPEGSDMRRLLDATDAKSLDKVVHDLATENKLFNESSGSSIIYKGASIQVNPETGMIGVEGTVKAPAPPTSVSGPREGLGPIDQTNIDRGETPPTSETIPAPVSGATLPTQPLPAEQSTAPLEQDNSVLRSGDGSAVVDGQGNPVRVGESIPKPGMNAFGIEVSATKAGIYAGADAAHTFAFGGTPVERANAIEQFLKANPNKIIFASDDTGKFRLAWHLVGGKAEVVGPPMRTTGFFGLGSTWMKPPGPDDLKTLIK